MKTATTSTEFTANNALSATAAERARFAAVLAPKPAQKITLAERLQGKQSIASAVVNLHPAVWAIGGLSVIWTGVSVALYLFY